MHKKQEDSQNGTSDRLGQINDLYPDSLDLFGWRMATIWNFGKQIIP
jgi:hypothetical protein